MPSLCAGTRRRWVARGPGAMARLPPAWPAGVARGPCSPGGSLQEQGVFCCPEHHIKPWLPAERVLLLPWQLQLGRRCLECIPLQQPGSCPVWGSFLPVNRETFEGSRSALPGRQTHWRRLWAHGVSWGPPTSQRCPGYGFPGATQHLGVSVA